MEGICVVHGVVSHAGSLFALQFRLIPWHYSATRFGAILPL